MWKKNTHYKWLVVLVLSITVWLTGCSLNDLDDIWQYMYYHLGNSTGEESVMLSGDVAFDYDSIPIYDGKPYVEVNGNIPYFEEEEITVDSFEAYGVLDALGRCTTSTACLSEDTIPSKDEERGAIGNIKPTGWYSKKYDCVEGKYAMNRCHCIGWQLGNENDNIRNLISGSRYLNLEMLEIENMVANYLKETGNHVMYRVTPIFIEEEMLCRGLLMEGYSVEDNGKGICYCVFFYNVQPGIEFNYSTGESWYTGEFLDLDSVAVNYDGIEHEKEGKESEIEVSPLPEKGKVITYILNRKSFKFHLESCNGVATMSEHNKEIFEGNREYLISIGYSPCGNCNP